ncbi:MAG: hypothetical protein LBD76_00750 [Prevotellaceae bacterium]|nr:hypothetical protein [Prevotellaceae bacterium]
MVKVEWMSDEEMNRYIEQLNCTPEQAMHEYTSLIRKIKAEKEIFLKCIDAELAKGDLSEYAKAEMIYKFIEPHMSLIAPITKLDFLKVFKEFILTNNEDVLPEMTRVVHYLSSLTDADIAPLSQKTAAKAVTLLYEGIKDFDRECFLTGALDDNMGHYQTFTANKSIDDVDKDMKWMFENGIQFVPDTMAYQRITTYDENNLRHINLTLIVASLFKKDYPDFRALRVKHYPPKKHYGSEIKSHYDPEDPFVIELYSSSLAKLTAGYFNFDYKKRFLPVISSGGDIGYRGIVNKDKITTQAQKLSFLAGVFMRYGCSSRGISVYNIPVANSLSAATVCSAILKETGCEHVDYIDKTPDGHTIIFTPSSDVANLIRLVDNVHNEMTNCFLK